jgi:hypothetical protein
MMPIWRSTISALPRHEFEQRFTDRHMAEDNARIYQQLLGRSPTQAAA